MTLVVVQEAWGAAAPVAPPWPGMRLLDGDSELAAWIRDMTGSPHVERPATWWQTVFVAGLAIHSVHLDPYDVATRVKRLQILAERLPIGDNVVLGDFNLAPRPVDGIYGTSPSRFTSARERRAFAELLTARELADATAGDPPEFTLSRQIHGSDSSFRCDLALLPASWATTRALAAHETRIGPDAFTDHSGLVVRVAPVADRPIGRPANRASQVRRRSAPAGGTGANLAADASFKTAIARRGPSAPAQVLGPFIERVVAQRTRGSSVRAVLDYGCGRGADVDYFRNLEMDAVGYDPHVPFGFAELPTDLFLVVTIIFVLNVLPTADARLEVLRTGSSHTNAAAPSSTAWTPRSFPAWARCLACDPRVRSRACAMRPSWRSPDNHPRRGPRHHKRSRRNGAGSSVSLTRSRARTLRAGPRAIPLVSCCRATAQQTRFGARGSGSPRLLARHSPLSGRGQSTRQRDSWRRLAH